MVKLFIISFTFLISSIVIANERSFFGHLTSKDKVIIVTKKGLRLKSDALIRADKIIFKGPIITNGYRLELDTREMIIETDTAIIGFDSPAVDMSFIPEPILNIPSKAAQIGRNGAKGTRGYKGKAGKKGVDAKQDSKEIILSFSKLSGLLKINADGQKGGLGGKGGTGGQGGLGGDGVPGWAKVTCGSDKGEPGGNAGDGGNAGLGGNGGQGGAGGNKISVVIKTAQNLNESILISNNNGEPGDGGEVGEYGAPGAAGNPGAAARDEGCVTDTHSVRAGGRGSAGIIGESALEKAKRKGRKGKKNTTEDVGTIISDIGEMTMIKDSVSKNIVELNLTRYQHKALLELVSYLSGRESIDISKIDEQMLDLLMDSFSNADLFFVENLKDFLDKEYLSAIDEAADNSNVNDVKKRLKELKKDSETMLKLLSFIIDGQYLKAKAIVESLHERSLFKLDVLVDDLSNLCLDYLDVESLYFARLLPRFVSAPACTKNGIAVLRNDIFAKIELNEQYKPTVFPVYLNEGLEQGIDDVLKMVGRIPTNSPLINTLVINNERVRDRDIRISLNQKIEEITVLDYQMNVDRHLDEKTIYDNFTLLLGLKVNLNE